MQHKIFIPTSDWSPSPEALRAAAVLVYESDSHFYKEFFPDKNKILERIERSLLLQGTDLHTKLVAISEDIVTGICCGYPVKEMLGRRLKSMYVFSDLLTPEAKKKLSRFGRSLQTPPPDSAYLAKIAVDRTCRGLGVGSSLLHAFEQMAMDMGQTGVSLHAHRTNDAIQTFYNKHGYTGTQEEDSDYILLCKQL